jgi:hypothetical protein
MSLRRGRPHHHQRLPHRVGSQALPRLSVRHRNRPPPFHPSPRSNSFHPRRNAPAEVEVATGMLVTLMHRFDGCAVMWDRASMSFSCMGTKSASLRCIIRVSNYDRPIATRQLIRVITAFVSGEPDGRTAPMSSMAGKQHLRVERMSARKPQRLNTARKPWRQRRYWLSPSFREAPAAG